MSMHICGAGRALILNWDTVDEIGELIAKKFFHEGVTVVGRWESLSFTYLVSGLTEQDKNIWNDLFIKYDTSVYYDPPSLFYTSSGKAELPASVSVKLINEILPEIQNKLPTGYEDFTTNMITPMPYAVVLFEHIPDSEKHWLL